MKIKKIKTDFCLKSNGYLDQELKSLCEEIIFLKISFLEDCYLREENNYPDEILAYMRFLRENIILFKTKYIDWTDTWLREIKPYILDHFLDEKTLHQEYRRDVSGQKQNLYDRLHDIAKYSDLHDE